VAYRGWARRGGGKGGVFLDGRGSREGGGKWKMRSVSGLGTKTFQEMENRGLGEKKG